MNIYFSDFFRIPPTVLSQYGAFDISLNGDLPLFVDPFLLFNSEKPRYQELHAEIIKYMRFLKERTLSGAIAPALVDAWFAFKEVRQNWLGFCLSGNHGHGLGAGFARALHKNFNTVFRNFGEETVSHSSHLEKLCLVRDGVGRDMISDFTTNMIKSFLADYTQKFALKNLPASRRRKVSVPDVMFNYDTQSWTSKSYELPFFMGDYVLLTPKDMLTKDEAWINRPELIEKFAEIAVALPDPVLRAQVNEYLARVLPREPDVKREKINLAITQVIERFPQVLDYYILDKEQRGEEAVSISSDRVREVESWFVNQVRRFVHEDLEPSGFYAVAGNTYTEAKLRINYLKDVIENKGGHRIFYHDGRVIEREADLQILYRLTWFATKSDVSREANDGRGPADFKISRGARDKTIIEFKLASNTQLERNLEKQTSVYEKASDTTNPTIKGILYFSSNQLIRVKTILKRLNLEDSPHIVLIDGGADNKPSGSKA